jgi:GTP diphosphokinase / guanosine-3',5'-bis(diphosphate) 3'-diphosphatase
MSLIRAIAYAQKRHAGQTRKTGEPYVEHTLRVLDILKRYNLDKDILIAGVLHDITEDTEDSNLLIADEFGKRVATMVYALSKNQKTKPSKESPSDSHQRYKTRFRFYLARFAKVAKEEPGVVFIKMADQIDNLATLDIFPPEKQKRKIHEIEEDFLPLYEKIAVAFCPELQEKYARMRVRLVERLKRRKNSKGAKI